MPPPLSLRWRRRAAALGLAVLAGLAAGPARPLDRSATVPMTAQPVAADTWFVQGQAAMGSAANQNFISNASFVVTPAGVVVIDSLGSPPLAERLLALIRERTQAPIRYVVVTHCHADHIYGLQVLKAAGAQVVAHVGCRDYLSGETAQLRLKASRDELFPWVDEDTRLVQPDIWVGDGGRDDDLLLDLGGRALRVRHAGPAHTTEDLVVHDPATGVLFTGDVVFRGRVPYVGNADSRSWIAAIDRMLDLKPRLMVPGHGPISQQPVADLAQTREYLAFLRKTMGDAARNLEPFDDVYARTDWSAFSALPLFTAVNRMNAYNTYLLMETEAR